MSEMENTVKLKLSGEGSRTTIQSAVGTEAEIESIRTESGETKPLSKKEIISYGLSSPAVNIVALLCATFLSAYYTDTVGIPIAMASMIFLICRIGDGVTDIIMGMIIDRTHTRFGKAKPWALIGAVAGYIAGIFVFNVPDMSVGAQMVYACISYFLETGIFNTMTGISVSTMTSLITDRPQDRAALGASFFTIQMILTVVLAAVTLPIVSAFGGGNGGWRTYLIMLAFISTFCLIIFLKNTKERTTTISQSKDEKKPSFKIAVKALFTNQYFILATCVGLLINILSAVINGVGVYYSVRILGGEQYYTLLAIAMGIPYFMIPLFLPLMNKFGQTKVAVGGLVIALASSVPMILFPDNLPVSLVAMFLRSLGACPILACYNAFVAAAADYGQWKSGIAMQGVSFSGTSFGNKVGAALGSLFYGLVLGAAGYDGMAAVEPESALIAIRLLFTLAPAMIVIAMILVILPFRKLEAMQPQIHKDLYENETFQ